jgi:D-alanyl-lipoteichoic acid acyltransferase DltB (MBOAT superfamily)
MWHKGFNHWLIRYMYIPLGGKKNLVSLFCVIAFVAFWHDHTLHIVLWALILVLFMLPEVVVKAFFRKNYSHVFCKFWFKEKYFLHKLWLLTAFTCLSTMVNEVFVTIKRKPDENIGMIASCYFTSSSSSSSSSSS